MQILQLLGAENYLDMAGDVSLKKDGDVIDVSSN